MKRKDDMYRDQIHIENGSLKIRKATGAYKDYGGDLSLWSEAFLNYSAIPSSLFGTTSPVLSTWHWPISIAKSSILPISTNGKEEFYH